MKVVRVIKDIGIVIKTFTMPSLWFLIGIPLIIPNVIYKYIRGIE